MECELVGFWLLIGVGVIWGEVLRFGQLVVRSVAHDDRVRRVPVLLVGLRVDASVKLVVAVVRDEERTFLRQAECQGGA